MPWKETCVVDERVAFIVAWQGGDQPTTALCEAHGISRKTGYKWRDRFLAAGWDGLADAPRAAPPGAGHAGPARRGDPRAAAARALFRAKEAAGRTRARAARSGLAGALDDRRAAAPRGAEPAASAAAHGAPADPALCRGAARQRPLVHRLQGLVPHARRATLRPAHRDRRGEPLPSRMPHHGADHRGRALGLRAAVPRVRAAAAHAHGQRPALRLEWRRRADPP